MQIPFRRWAGPAFVFICCALLPAAFAAPAADALRQVGVAQVDITPDYPIRLNGYLVRKTESQGVAERLRAKALAIGSDQEHPAILLTVDNCMVPAWVRAAVVESLRQQRHIRPDHVALCSSHTHSAPCLTGITPTIFGEPIPPEHQARIDRYTRELIAALEKVALDALDRREPCVLSWGRGRAGFAANRRTAGGPVDHDLPVLVARDAHGQVRAIFASYACHCTTLGGDFNQVCGDWAGYAQEDLERDHPGALALIALGCGADANPKPRPGLELAQQHGQEIATAVDAVLTQQLSPLRGRLVCRFKQIQLPFQPLPTRAEWEARASKPGPVGYHARVNLAKLQRGEKLPAKLPYAVAAWTFGDDLAMVFLAGEVVVDYSLRLKREFDPARVWVNAYANDVPCYIPSRRILTEGGYEGGEAMIYFDRPAKLSMQTEERIVSAVHALVPRGFLARNPAVAAGPGALAPALSASK